MPTTTIQGLPYPASSAAANVPADIQALAQAVEVKTNMIFTTTAARDAALTSPSPGEEVFITGTGEKQIRTASGLWVVCGGRALPFSVCAGTVTWPTATATGYTVTVTFPTGRFTVIPIVLITLWDNHTDAQKSVVKATAITTTTADLSINKGDGTVYTSQNITAGWMALQMTSSSAAG